MRLYGRHLKKLTPVSVAAYFFVFAICTKAIHSYASLHPPREKLLAVHGIVRDVHLGGEGSATRLQVESHGGTQRYSSYYGKVWPGMERIQVGDRVDLLAERDRLKSSELLGGKRYYIWELTHQQETIVGYGDVLKMVRDKEVMASRYINLWLAISCIVLLATYCYKTSVRSNMCGLSGSYSPAGGPPDSLDE